MNNGGTGHFSYFIIFETLVNLILVIRRNNLLAGNQLESKVPFELHECKL